MTDDKTQPTKEKKHLIINHLLCNLEREISCFENLVNEIEGSEIAKTINEETNSMSLVEFLNDTPNKLNELIKRLSDYRARLQEYLF